MNNETVQIRYSVIKQTIPCSLRYLYDKQLPEFTDFSGGIIIADLGLKKFVIQTKESNDGNRYSKFAMPPFCNV